MTSIKLTGLDDQKKKKKWMNELTTNEFAIFRVYTKFVSFLACVLNIEHTPQLWCISST